MATPRGKLCVFFVIVLVVTPIGYYSHQRELARQDLEHLLDGDRSNCITKMTISGQRKAVVLADRKSLAYFSAMCNTSRRGAHKVGLLYGADLELSTGASVSCSLYVPEEKDEITILVPPRALFGDHIPFLVTLTNPVPDGLAEVLSNLR
jgi:hypothetical protein